MQEIIISNTSGLLNMLKSLLDKIEDIVITYASDNLILDKILNTDEPLYTLVHDLLSRTPNVWKGYLGNRIDFYKGYNKNAMGEIITTLSIWKYESNKMYVVFINVEPNGKFYLTADYISDELLNSIS